MRSLRSLTTKIPLIIRVVSLYVLVGAGLWAAPQILPEQNAAAGGPPITSPVKQIVLNQEIITGKPVRFSIKTLNIDLPVKDGYYNERAGAWTLSDDAVYFALITSQPNDTRGNTFIYGHNQDQVIGAMQNIKVGDIVVIKTDNKHTFRYAYRHDSFVKPDFTKVLKEDPDTPQLTVMTCEGIWSSERRLMYFELLGVR